MPAFQQAQGSCALSHVLPAVYGGDKAAVVARGLACGEFLRTTAVQAVVAALSEEF